MNLEPGLYGGIFAIFGAPLAHEDHPLRALYAFARKCPSCGAENPWRAKFCAECSTAIDGANARVPNSPRSAISTVRVADGVEAAPPDGEL